MSFPRGSVDMERGPSRLHRQPRAPSPSAPTARHFGKEQKFRVRRTEGECVLPGLDSRLPARERPWGEFPVKQGVCR